MLRTRWRLGESRAAPTHRLEALADGVFAIAMTLLVLELSVPSVSEVADEAVAEALREMWPEFSIYALSFLVLGMFWLIHKMIFDAIEGADPQLTWLNVAYLLVTALLPFSTALVGEYRALTAVAVVYGANVLLAFVAACSLFAYATYDGRLTAPDFDPVLVKGGNRMGLVYMVILAATVALAFVSPIASYVAIAAVVGTMIAATMLGRWEAVMVWARDTDLEGKPKATV